MKPQCINASSKMMSFCDLYTSAAVLLRSLHVGLLRVILGSSIPWPTGRKHRLAGARSPECSSYLPSRTCPLMPGAEVPRRAEAVKMGSRRPEIPK